MNLIIPEGPFDGYIFDCDGTVADTMPAHYAAWCRALSEYNCPFPEPYFYSLGGVPTEKIVAILNEKHGLAMPVRETAAHKEEIYLESLSAVRRIDPVVAFLESWHGKKPMAIVSGGHRHVVIRTLEAAGLLDRFDTLVCAEDCEHGKPAPDPFLEAARRIAVPPGRCLAFEDAEAGITSARAAGMQVVIVPTVPYR